MAELPSMPLMTDALLADTTHMSAEEFGAYCRILFVMWRHGGTLKEDEKELARIAGVSMAVWRKIREKVTRPLTLSEGIFSQKRLTETWREVQEYRQQKRDAANARWGKKGMRPHMRTQSGRNANQNQIIESSFLTERESVETAMRTHGRTIEVSQELKASLRRIPK